MEAWDVMETSGPCWLNSKNRGYLDHGQQGASGLCQGVKGRQGKPGPGSGEQELASIFLLKVGRLLFRSCRGEGWASQ